MLYFQKAVNLKDTKAKKVYEEFFSKLEKKGFNFFQINELMELYTEKTLLPESFSKEKEKRFKELLSKMGVTEEDLESLVKKAQKFSEETAKLKFSYLQRALKEFQTAVRIDPENALAYYQLGNFYSGALGENLPETSQAAEEAYYKAALLLKKKGDLAGYKEVVKKLEMLNPSSQYLKKLKKGLNQNGSVLIIDFKRKKTPIGPPPQFRIPLYQVESELEEAGFRNITTNDCMLDYQYVIIAEK